MTWRKRMLKAACLPTSIKQVEAAVIAHRVHPPPKAKNGWAAFGERKQIRPQIRGARSRMTANQSVEASALPTGPDAANEIVDRQARRMALLAAREIASDVTDLSSTAHACCALHVQRRWIVREEDNHHTMQTR
jgi:hypothetical protein